VKPRLVEYLACPICQGTLELEARDDTAGEIITGALCCRSSGHRFPIERGIPRLLPPALSIEKRKTAAAFGHEWRHFVELHPEYREQFLDWIKPIEPVFFRDKVVLDAGCGIGRHAYFACQFGARDVIAMDLSEAVETAYQNIGNLPQAHVIQADIYAAPFRCPPEGGPFDFIYSIGVLHHLPDPEAGFQALVRYLRPGGTIFGWVYGYENNGIVHHLIDPLRTRVTSRFPPPLLRVLSWPLAVVLHGLVKGVYRPLRHRRVFARLPSHDYLLTLAGFNFRHNYSIVFDHLVAPTAFYIKRAAFESWFHRAGLNSIELSWRNRNSWRGRGQRAASPSADVSPSPLAGEGRGGGSPS
jgi:SAM-dependent methyltransferase